MKRQPLLLSKLLVFAGCCLLPSVLFAQSGSIGGTTALRTPDGNPIPISQVSLTYQAPAKQRTYQLEDIIYVDVKEATDYTNTANNQRKKKIETTAEITAWSKIKGLFSLPVRADADLLPGIGGKLDHKTQNQGTLNHKEKLEFRVACRVTSILDNGNLVIEGSDKTVIDEEESILFVGGNIRPDSIKPDHSIKSEQLSNKIIKRFSSGNVYDTYRRPWGARLIEQYKPF